MTVDYGLPIAGGDAAHGFLSWSPSVKSASSTVQFAPFTVYSNSPGQAEGFTTSQVGGGRRVGKHIQENVNECGFQKEHDSGATFGLQKPSGDPSQQNRELGYFVSVGVSMDDHFSSLSILSALHLFQ